jgi:hypothetical protein
MGIKLGNKIPTSIKLDNQNVDRIALGNICLYASSSRVQYFNVVPCAGGGVTSSLAINVGTTLEVGYAVRPTEYGTSTRLPGYDTGCYKLVSSGSSGIYCGTLAPAVNCSQSVCL